MQKVFEFSGDDVFFPGGYIYPNPKESVPFLSLGRQVDLYFPARKRSRVSAPIVVSRKKYEQKQQRSIDILPDECLFEIFRHLNGSQERTACACVSKRWLMLLSTICKNEIANVKTHLPSAPTEKGVSHESVEMTKTHKKGENVSCQNNKNDIETDCPEVESDGYLSRCLEGNKATDVRLASIAIGTSSRGGLGKLSIRGNNTTRGVTNLGLQAIARCCPSLRVLSLWNVKSIDDEALLEIANGCHLLEKLDLCQCPGITDKGLVAIAKGCPNLSSLTIESCLAIGNESMQGFGCYCPNLKCVSVKNCPLVGDQGIASLLSSASNTLTKLRLQSLNISDMSFAVIGCYGKAITELALIGLQKVSEKGFWVMGSGQGLQSLRSLAVSSCQGVTDVGVEAVGRGCPNLKQFFLRKCTFLSDNGLVSFVNASQSLECLQLEECHRITLAGIVGLLINSGKKFKALSLSGCLGIRDTVFGFPLMSSCESLQSLAIRNCPGFGDTGLAVVARLCQNLMDIDLSGLHLLTDEGVLPLVESSEAGLVKVNLGGCINVTDKVASTIAKLHGGTLELLGLDGCAGVTDASLVAIAENCSLLSELDVSKCVITDSGIRALAFAVQLNLQILSLSGCSLISGKSLPYLEELGRTLVGLNIQHCKGINSGMVDHLGEHLWKCDILS